MPGRASPVLFGAGSEEAPAGRPGDSVASPVAAVIAMGSLYAFRIGRGVPYVPRRA